MLTRTEAEDLIYESYMTAQKYVSYESKDSSKRHPQYSRPLIIRQYEQYRTPSILVTGSKGKGSVAMMLSCLLGLRYRTGLMTSPHLSNFCERFRVNNEIIADEEFARHMSELQPEIAVIQERLTEREFLSPIGIQAALALKYFGNHGTQINIFECGKGARYDDVPQIPHEYAVINSIFLEHTRELGDTLEEIAQDKAYIIDEGTNIVFVAEQEPEVLKIISRRAQTCQTELRVYGLDFRAENIVFTKDGMCFDVITNRHTYSNLCVPLLGVHQAKNCAIAIAIYEEILYRELHCQKINKQICGKQRMICSEFADMDILELVKINEETDAGIRNVLMQLNWPGRMEILSRDPFVLLDACINRASAGQARQVIEYLQLKKPTVIIGIPDDKDYLGVVLEMHSLTDKIILTASSNLHYHFSDRQKHVIEEQLGLQSVNNSDVLKIYQTTSTIEALKLALQKDRPIVILGTTSVVAEYKINQESIFEY